MPSVLLSLGSNLGEPRYNLRRAVDSLRGLIDVVRVSSAWRTEPLDSPAGSADFLNVVVAGISSLHPTSCSAGILEIEARLGRRRPFRNAPRTIDIDLVLYGSTVLNTPGCRFLIPGSPPASSSSLRFASWIFRRSIRPAGGG